MCKDFLCTLSKQMGTKCPAKVYIVTEKIVYVDKVPMIEPCGTLSMDEFNDICREAIKQYGNTAPVYLPDARMKQYKYEDVVNDGNLTYIDTLEYIAESHDCDDFAAEAFGRGYGLVWSNVHALNWFIDENGKFWFIEPQTHTIADKLDSWQGKQIRFLVGR